MRDAAAHHVEVGLGVQDRRRAVGRVHDAGVDALGRIASSARAKRSSWRSKSQSPGTSAVAKCVNVPSSVRPGKSAERRGELGGVLGAHADAVHAGVDLEVVARLGVRAQRLLAERARANSRVVTVGMRSCSSELADAARAARRAGGSGPAMPASRSSIASSTRRDAEPVGAGRAAPRARPEPRRARSRRPSRPP